MTTTLIFPESTLSPSLVVSQSTSETLPSSIDTLQLLKLATTGSKAFHRSYTVQHSVDHVDPVAIQNSDSTLVRSHILTTGLVLTVSLLALLLFGFWAHRRYTSNIKNRKGRRANVGGAWRKSRCWLTWNLLDLDSARGLEQGAGNDNVQEMQVMLEA